MKVNLFLFLFFLLIHPINNYAITPYHPGEKGIEIVLIDDIVVNAINSAERAIQDHNYSHALEVLKSVRNYIYRLGYNNIIDYNQIIKKIDSEIEYCELKLKKTEENSLYKTAIGSYRGETIYAYGNKGKMLFVVVSIFGTGMLIIPEKQIKEFTSILDDLEKSLKLKSNNKTRRYKLPRSFPIVFTALYYKNTSKGFLPTDLTINIQKSNWENKYGAVFFTPYNDFPIMLFETSDIDKLQDLRNCISTAAENYYPSSYGKVKDFDTVLQLIRAGYHLFNKD